MSTQPSANQPLFLKVPFFLARNCRLTLAGSLALVQYSAQVLKVMQAKAAEEKMLRDVFDKMDADGGGTLDKKEVSEFGSFGWVLDPEGNKVELWEPPEGA